MTSIPLSIHIASATFLFPTATKALANFLYDALVSTFSQDANIFTHVVVLRVVSLNHIQLICTDPQLQTEEVPLGHREEAQVMEDRDHILWWERVTEGRGHILWWERVTEDRGHILWWERVTEGGGHIFWWERVTEGQGVQCCCQWNPWK